MTENFSKQVQLDVRVTAEEVLRCMGCRRGVKVHPQVTREIGRRLEEAHALMQPRAVYVVREVQRMTDTQLDLRDGPSFHGPIAGFLKPARRVVVYVLTIGDELELQASERMNDNDLLGGFTLDAIGSATTDIAGDRLTEHLLHQEADENEAVTPPFSPGYCGLPLDQQAPLFAYLEASLIGVQLNDSFMMKPVKSCSGLIGIGDREEVVERGVPCQWCELNDCAMRRA